MLYNYLSISSMFYNVTSMLLACLALAGTFLCY